MEPATLQPLSQQANDEKVCNQEFKDLLSSLPKERGLAPTYSYQYQGFWYSPLALQGVINCQNHFEPRKNDVILVSAPKSSTTWLKAIIYTLINREVHPPQNPHHPLLNKSPHQLVPFFELLDPSEYDAVCNSSESSTRIFATHIPVGSLPKSLRDDSSSSNCRIVYLCRDIKDNLVSLFHFANKVNMRPSPISLEEAFDLYCKGISAVGPIWDQILGYWKESLQKPHKVLFMRCEDLKNEPRFQLRRLAHFLGKPFSLEEENSCLLDQIICLCSFDTMSKLKVNNTGHLKHGISNSSFFRNGIVGDGKKCLTADMASRLDQITEEKFHGSGLFL
ncbi:cytosolic sulfotransferase 5-like [Apium graveolens]|uniref:cytosolic sulfotransferase 5-like n=1 Tax=Apium graveolens TaxID=4045 RepID=UPI003D7B664B